MWLGVLGPVRCAVDGSPVEVRGRLNQALLAALAVDRRRVTGIDELVDALWRDAAPAAAEKVIRNRVSLLRGLLGPSYIETVGGGYRLGPDVVVDASRFEDTSRTGHERLALWRGAPFEDIDEWPPAQVAAIRLDELRAHLEEAVIAEQLDAGADTSPLVGAVEAMVEAAPFRERRWALLMRTLYLSGRQHDALRAFQRARDLLRDELGLSPGSELLAVERAILNQEASLEPRGQAVTSGAARAVRPASSLIGRVDDAAALAELLDWSRLVTLVGLGGVGKTSLARDISRRWPEHRLVDLRAIDDASGVGDAVARGLRISSGGSAGDAIASWASSAAGCLVVLDNCEHVRHAAVDVADVLVTAGEGTTVLTTSRIPLGHRAETVYRVDPLARPDAIALYRARSMQRRRTDLDDADIDRLCEAVSDLPLAIELAAARSSILSPADMVADLASFAHPPSSDGRRAGRFEHDQGDDVFDIVAWSVGALSPDALMLFRRGAVFPAGFTMAAAHAMGGPELDRVRVEEAFAELAEASLIEVQFQAGTRYRYLELIRRRADQLLDDAAERDLAERRMVQWAIDATRTITYLDLPELLAELPNLVAAADHACRSGDIEAALQITGASFVFVLAQRSELLDAKVVAVELPGAQGHPRYARSCAELAHAMFILRGRLAESRRFAEMAIAADPDGRAAGWAWHVLAHIDGDLDHVRRSLAIARAHHDPLLTMYASSVIVDNEGRSGSPEAFELVADCDRVAAGVGEPWARTLATIVRGMAYCQVDPEMALIHLERAADMAERNGCSAYATVARALAGLAGDTNPRARLELTRRAIVDADAAGVAYMKAIAMARVARALDEMGRPDRAAIFAGAAYQGYWTSGDTGTRLYQISRDDHIAHGSMYDLGTTLDVQELVDLIDQWIAELDSG